MTKATDYVSDGRSEAPNWSDAPIGRVAAPLRDQVLGVLRQAILDFSLKPGQRLIEREIIERLGVSRTTVREAIGRLAVEGLVTIIPQKGAVVSVLSVEDAADLYEMRASLEALVVRRFVERATPEQVRRLRRSLQDIERAAEAPVGTNEELRSKDQFYEVLFAGASSPALEQVLSGLQGRVRVLRATSLSVPGRSKKMVNEIRAVVEAIEAGDSTRAADACVVHVRNAARAGLARLSETGSTVLSAPT